MVLVVTCQTIENAIEFGRKLDYALRISIDKLPTWGL